MRCNYCVDNRQKIEQLRKDDFYCALNDISSLEMVTCHSGIGEYEPSLQEREIFCFSEFCKCPRFKTKIR